MKNSKTIAGRSMGVLKIMLFAGLCALLLAGVACQTIGDYAEKRADLAAYNVIAEKQKEAGLVNNVAFSIDNEVDALTSSVLLNAPRVSLARMEYTTPTFKLSLADTIMLALMNNRDYKSREEGLFSSALGLTNTRYDFGAQFSASASGELTRTEAGKGLKEGQNDYEVFGQHGFSLGVRRILYSGAQISLDYTHSFLNYLTNESRSSGSNAVSAGLTQPLLRGFGPLVAYESLRQAERNMIYSVRDFQRYQQNFVIAIADRYYSLLNSREQLANTYSDYQQRLENLEKDKLYRDTGQKSDWEVDQSRQEVFRARIRYTDAQADYLDRLDRFKDFLGLPIDVDVGPDPKEFDAIAERGLAKPDMTLEKAIELALENRLDLKTTEDRLNDSRRDVKIALQNFLPKLDFTYNFSSSRTDPEEEFSLDLRNNTNTFGLDLSLPLDWTPRRNNYRNSLISLQQSERSVEAKRTEVILEVRNGWRQLERLMANYQVQLESVELARRRVDRNATLQRMNRATTQQVVEAQDDLLESQNAATQALVDYTIQRLRFWHAIERLEIDASGMWLE
ncbi:MAG: TolC family protein [Candidatus Sumerlaeia bacterium]